MHVALLRLHHMPSWRGT